MYGMRGKRIRCVCTRGRKVETGNVLVVKSNDDAVLSQGLGGGGRVGLEERWIRRPEVEVNTGQEGHRTRGKKIKEVTGYGGQR